MADDVAVVTILQPTSVIFGHNLHIYYVTKYRTQPIKLEKKVFRRLNLWIGRHISDITYFMTKNNTFYGTRYLSHCYSL